ncbi:MAG: hypothetical protein JETT_2260 [Candidatus Jettenia ecosi]|uniref:Uncharacterized protein n=1 Tax=Candidatus Jettenia ecosi TaxID=2494326 RepID=A0A533Q9T6_9BACT|nr:MAG: hypothetical protein JETT_2260 [Candidatus Jettenia ecosi]
MYPHYYHENKKGNSKNPASHSLSLILKAIYGKKFSILNINRL